MKEKNIEKRVNNIIKWRKNYPTLTINPKCDVPEELAEEYNKIQQDYAFLRIEKNHGELDESMLVDLREANVGGVFGYAKDLEIFLKNLENSTDERMVKGKVDIKTLVDLVNNYGSLRNFFDKAIDNIDNNKNEMPRKDIEIFNNITLPIIEIDLAMGGSNYTYNKILEMKGDNKLLVYSGEKLKETINNCINEKTDRYIFNRRTNFPFTDPKTGEKEFDNDSGIGSYEEIAKELGIDSPASIKKREEFILKRLKIRRERYLVDLDKELKDIDEKDEIIEELNRYRTEGWNRADVLVIQQRIKVLKEMKKLEDLEKKINKQKEERLDKLSKEYDKNKIDEFCRNENKEEYASFNEEIEGRKRFKKHKTELAKMNISSRLLNSLNKAKIFYLEDLNGKTEKEISELAGMGKKGFAELKEKMAEYNVEFKDEEKINKQIKKEDAKTKTEMYSSNTNLPVRVCKRLRVAGIRYMEDLENKTIDQIKNLSNLSEADFKKLKKKMEQYDIHFKEREIADNMDISCVLQKRLEAVGIKNMEDLERVTEDSIKNIKFIQDEEIVELKSEMKKHELSFKEKEEIQETQVSELAKENKKQKELKQKVAKINQFEKNVDKQLNKRNNKKIGDDQ